MRRAMNGVFVHIVWATWDRAPLLTSDFRAQAYRVIGAKCGELGAPVLAIGGVDDHIHLLVQLPATLSVAMLEKEVKGVSGHLLAKQAEAGGDFFKWQGAYGVFSVSPHELDKITSYIKRQQEHHAQQDIMPEWELPPQRDMGR